MSEHGCEVADEFGTPLPPVYSRTVNVPHSKGYGGGAGCFCAGQTLRARDDVERVLAYRDPLPASTISTLARLREEARRVRES